MSSIEQVRGVQGQRLKNSSRRTYEHRAKVFAQWVKDNHPTYHDQNEDVVEGLVLPLPESVITLFFGSLFNEEAQEYKSVSTVQGYRSAINDLYKKKRLRMDETVSNSIDEFIAGYKRIIAEKKESGVVSMHEGKRPLLVQGYRMLASKAFTSSKLYAHLYLLMQWNTMSRSVSVASLMYHWFWWEGDSLVVGIPRHKGDQEGKNAIPRHLYANPIHPMLCPVLSLAIHTLSHSFHSDEDQRIFTHKSVQDDFSKWLHETIKAFTDEESLLLAQDISLIGTHSIRKGVASYISSLPGTASVIAIFLRLGWSLGNVANRYLFEGEGGQDQLLGRIASMLPYDVQLATLPPHFVDSNVLTNEEWDIILPSRKQYPRSYQSVLPYLVASLVYHQKFLKEQLPQDHPIFNSRLFKGDYLNRLTPLVRTGIMNCGSGMVATGVPTHLSTTAKIEEIKSALVGWIDEQNKQFQKLHDQVPTAVVERIFENCTVNGAIPVTKSDMRDLIAEFRNELMQRSDSNCAVVEPTSTRSDSGYILYLWGNRHHFVPQSFRFPTCTIDVLWDLWFSGDKTNGYPPYSKLRGFDLNRTDATLLTKASQVMSSLLQFAANSGKVTDTRFRHVRSLELTDRDALFASIFLPYLNSIGCKSTAKYTTVYKHLLR